MRELISIASEINQAQQEIDQQVNRTIDLAIAQGHRLIQAKRLCQHGEWISWLSENTSIGRKQAAKYMRVASNEDQVLEIAANVSSGGHLTVNQAAASLAESKKPPAEEPPELDDFDQETDPVQTPPAKTVGPGAHSEGTDNEWYTPPAEIELIRLALGGGIDVDPCSNAHAQKTIKAGIHYTKENSGLNQPWEGTVFMNPPYSKGLCQSFCEKLVSEIEAGNITSAITLTNAGTDTSWFRTLQGACTAMVFTKRIQFVKENGEANDRNTKGQVYFYFGKNTKLFSETFSEGDRYVWIK